MADTTSQKPDSGTAKYDLYEVRGNGKRGKHWEGDTLDTLYDAWREANPGKMSRARFKAWVITTNNLTTVLGEPCIGHPKRVPNVVAGTIIKIPEGNEIGDFELVTKCPTPVAAPDNAAAVAPMMAQAAPMMMAPPPPPPPAEMVLSAPAQYAPKYAGAYDFAKGVNAYDYLFGKPPRDPAAEGHERVASRKGRNPLLPQDSEGTVARVDPSAEAIRAEGGEAKDKGRKKFILGRAMANGQGDGELEYGPSQTVFVGKNGEVIGPNKRFAQKFEENTRFVVDKTSGNLVSVVDGSALISFDRRMNPYHGNIWRDAMTARNVISQWSNTGDAIQVIAWIQAEETVYNKIGQRFFDPEKPSNPAADAKDAEALLQLNVKLAMNPVFWSISRKDAPPLGNPDTLRQGMDDVFQSRSFAGLPPAEQDRLRQKYQPLQATLDNPYAVDKATGGEAGRADWIQPAMEIAHERASVKLVQKGYGDRPGPKKEYPDTLEGDRARKADRQARVVEVGEIYARSIEASGVRVPSSFEQGLGLGALFDSQRQQKAPMDQAQTLVLDRLVDDPAFLEQYIQVVLTTRGALDKITGRLFDASRGDSDNRTMFGLKDDKQADRIANAFGAALGGPKFAKHKIDYDGDPISSPIKGLVRMATLGLYTPGKNRNQNRGLEKLPEAALERWNAGGESAAQIRAAFRDVAALARDGVHGGVDNAGASILLAVSPTLIEYRNNNKHSADFDRLLEIGGPRVARAIYDQTVVNINQIGNVAAGIEAATEQRAATKGDVITVSSSVAAQAAAAMRSGSQLVQQAEGPSGATINGTATMFNVDAANKAAKNPVALAAVLATANTPKLASQGEANANTITMSAESSPAAFSLIAAEMLAGGDKKLQGRLANYAGTIDRGGEEYSHYADMVKHYANSLRAAGTDVQKSNAVAAEAMKAFNQFFAAGDKHAAERSLAASQLAGMMQNDALVAGTYSDAFKSVNGENRNAFLAQLVADNKISDKDRLALVSLQNEPDMKAREAKLESWLAGYKESQHAVTAGPGLSYVEIIKVALLFTPCPDKPDVQSKTTGTAPECPGTVCLPPTRPPGLPPKPPSFIGG